MITPQQQQELREQIDNQFIQDVFLVMSTDAGRRMFAHVLQSCGWKDAEIRGNSRDFHAAGRRSVAIDLIGACEANGIAGLDLRCKAEREYALYQQDLIDKIKAHQYNNAGKGVINKKG